MMERMNKSVSTEDVEPNSQEASPVWTEERDCVVGRGGQREHCEESRVLQKCELQSDTESCKDPLKKGRGVAAWKTQHSKIQSLSFGGLRELERRESLVSNWHRGGKDCGLVIQLSLLNRQQMQFAVNHNYIQILFFTPQTSPEESIMLWFKTKQNKTVFQCFKVLLPTFSPYLSFVLFQFEWNPPHMHKLNGLAVVTLFEAVFT